MFEWVFDNAQSRSGRRARLVSLPVAVVIHGLVVTVLLVAQTWAVEAIPDPPITVSFVTVSPPPSDGGGRRVSPASRPLRTAPPTLPAQPRTVPGHVPVVWPPQELVGRPGEVGPGGGAGNGEPGDSGGEEPENWGVAGPPEESEQVLRLVAQMTPPRPVMQTSPVYPEVARKARHQGKVIVEAVIDRWGRVGDVRVLRDIGFGCGEAAVSAIRTWRYAPALLNGRPVSVYLTVTVSFQLN